MLDKPEHPPQPNLVQRLNRLRAAMEEKELHAFVVSTLPNAFYFTGFACSNPFLIITNEECIFLTDFRYAEAAEQNLVQPWHLVVASSPGATKEIAQILSASRPLHIGFEGTASYDHFKKLTELAPQGTLFIESARIIRDLRAQKDEFEIAAIEKAQELNEEVLANVLAGVSFNDITERGLLKELRKKMVEKEVEEAFPSIVAFGEAASRPHAVPGDKKLTTEAGVVLVDMGVRQNHYCSDMTRTFGYGTGANLQKVAEIYQIVLDAQLAALDSVRPGIAASEVDQRARDVIEKAGYGEFFGHGLGHGVGLEIHEAPTLNPHSTDVLEPGMVITIEPGIYLPGIGGVRIEDLIVVEHTGYRNLTYFPKEWKILRK
ncbi:MAG: M24 family metallopeptidase [Candidatus Sumerlaeaceae bacterium]